MNILHNPQGHDKIKVGKGIDHFGCHADRFTAGRDTILGIGIDEEGGVRSGAEIGVAAFHFHNRLAGTTVAQRDLAGYCFKRTLHQFKWNAHTVAVYKATRLFHNRQGFIIKIKRTGSLQDLHGRTDQTAALIV